MTKKSKKNTSNLILKSAQVSSNELLDADLEKINALTLSPLTKEEVFTFKVVMCDNEIDRMDEVFPLKSLEILQVLYIGKTFIKDHNRASDNQVARIYDTEVVPNTDQTSKTGEPYNELVAHCYMVVTDSNKDLITEIKGGIKKEVSVGCMITKAICSICGTDNRKGYCEHFWGEEYEGKKCYYSLEDPEDAYELSFVAVPAQPLAGTRKSYDGGVKRKKEEKKMKKEDEMLDEDEILDDEELDLEDEDDEEEFDLDDDSEDEDDEELEFDEDEILDDEDDEELEDEEDDEELDLEDDEDDPDESDSKTKRKNKTKELQLRQKSVGSFIFTQKQKHGGKK